MPIALAVAAHPDDIAIDMAGTLLHLKKKGWELHCVTLASGSGGSSTLDAKEIVKIRRQEEEEACKELGATYHPGFVNDYEIIYSTPLLHKVAALIRKVAPDIILTQNISDYMADHSNTASVTISAAFAKGHRNFPTDPPTPPINKDVALYIAQPYGNRDQFRRWVMPEIYVDIKPVEKEKEKVLRRHKSQVEEFAKDAGDKDALVNNMRQFCKEVGDWSKRYEIAEGWRRHSHLGYAKKEIDPLGEALRDVCFIDPEYETSLFKSSQTDRNRD